MDGDRDQIVCRTILRSVSEHPGHVADRTDGVLDWPPCGSPRHRSRHAHRLRDRIDRADAHILNGNDDQAQPGARTAMAPQTFGCAPGKIGTPTPDRFLEQACGHPRISVEAISDRYSGVRTNGIAIQLKAKFSTHVQTVLFDCTITLGDMTI